MSGQTLRLRLAEWLARPASNRAFAIAAQNGKENARLIARLSVATDALREALDDAVDRWHETNPNEERSLHEWLGMTWEQYAAYVERGIDGYLDARAAFGVVTTTGEEKP